MSTSAHRTRPSRLSALLMVLVATGLAAQTAGAQTLTPTRVPITPTIATSTPTAASDEVGQLVRSLFDSGELGPLLGVEDQKRIDTRTLGACMRAAPVGDTQATLAYLQTCYRAGPGASEPPAPAATLPPADQPDVLGFVKGLFDRGELAPLLGVDDPSGIDTRVLGACMMKASQGGIESTELADFLRDCYQMGGALNDE